MGEALSQSAQRIQDALDRLGVSLTVVELSDSTRTAADAAKAIGCTVAQIAKSIVFRGAESGTPVLVIASGVNRVNERRIAELVGEPVEKADAAFVRAATGFAIGGVPPVGHGSPLTTFLDADLVAQGEIWAAAGTPHSVFRLTAETLVAMTGGRVEKIV